MRREYSERTAQARVNADVHYSLLCGGSQGSRGESFYPSFPKNGCHFLAR